MDTGKLNLWIQGATGIALVVGLALVIWELQQSRNIAMAQITSDIFAYFLQQQSAVMGEGASLALAKACDEPTKLTTQDKIVLGRYYGSIVNRTRRVAQIEANSGINYMGEERFREITDINFTLVFQTEFGRWWWETMSGTGEPLRGRGDQLLNESGPVRCNEHYKGYDQWLNDKIDTS